MVRTRIRRHLTNQRTDAVAMSVLDPFEVFTIKVWPLPEYQDVSKKKDPNGWKAAKQHLNALERAVHDKAIADSTFNAILNEKDPEPTDMQIQLPVVCEGRIVSDEVAAIRAHPDSRIAQMSAGALCWTGVCLTPDYESGGQRFESVRARHFLLKTQQQSVSTLRSFP